MLLWCLMFVLKLKPVEILTFSKDCFVLLLRIAWNGKVFPSIVTVNVSLIIHLLEIPATPTFFATCGAMIKRPTWTYFDSVWLLFITKDSERYYASQLCLLCDNDAVNLLLCALGYFNFASCCCLSWKPYS